MEIDGKVTGLFLLASYSITIHIVLLSLKLSGLHVIVRERGV